MKKKSWILVGGILTTLVLVSIVGAVVVYAQSPTPPTPPAGSGEPGRFGDGRHQLGQTELNAAAKALGLTADDLSAQMQGGKTLAEIATAQGVDLKTVMEALRAAHPAMLGPSELDAASTALGISSADLSAELSGGKTLSDVAAEKGVSLQTVQDAIQTAHRTQLTSQIDQAVTDGTMTQDKADWLLEGLDKGFLDGPGAFGFGFGFGPGGPHGPDSPQPQAIPSATP